MIDKKRLEQLAKIQKIKGLSLRQLAKLSKSSVASINKFFANDEAQEFETKEKICNALGVTLKEKKAYSFDPEPSELLKELTQ